MLYLITFLIGLAVGILATLGGIILLVNPDEELEKQQQQDTITMVDQDIQRYCWGDWSDHLN